MTIPRLPEPFRAAIVVIDMVKHSETLAPVSDKIQQLIMLKLLDFLNSDEIQRFAPEHSHYTGDGALLLFQRSESAINFCNSLPELWSNAIQDVDELNSLDLPFRAAVHVGLVYPIAYSHNPPCTSHAIDLTFSIASYAERKQVLASQAAKDESKGIFSWDYPIERVLKGECQNRLLYPLRDLTLTARELSDSDSELEHYKEAHAGLALFIAAQSTRASTRSTSEVEITLYRKAIELGLPTPDLLAIAYYNLGTALANEGKGDIDAAIASFREAIRIKPEYAEAHNNLGIALAQKGDLDGATAEHREAIRLKPDVSEAHDNLGIALAQKGDLDGAIAEHREAIRLKPDDSNAHYNLGVALAEKGDLDGAIAEYREAIRITPDYSTAHNNLGVALKVKGDLDGAIAEYREAIRILADNSVEHYNLGNALADKGDLDGAIAEYREAIRIQPDNLEARNNLGNALADKGDLDGAIAEYLEALRIKPDHLDAHNNLGRALWSNGDLDGAIGEYREAIRLKPDFTEAHNNLGAALAKKGDLDGAIAEFREALRISPDFMAAGKNLESAISKKKTLDDPESSAGRADSGNEGEE